MQIEKRIYGLRDLLPISFACNTWAAGFLGLQQVLVGVVPTLQVLLTAKFIDGAILVYQGALEARRVYPSLVAILVLLAYQHLVNGVMSFATSRLNMGFEAKFRTAITTKRARLAYHYIENPETWDLMSRVATGVEKQMSRGFLNLLSLGSNVIRVAGLLFLLFTQAWWAALIIVAFSIPLLVIGIKSGQAAYEVHRDVSKFKRKNEYLGEVLLGRENTEERAIFGFGPGINSVWHRLFEEARILELQTAKKW